MIAEEQRPDGSVSQPDELRRLPPIVRGVRAAFVFFTRIPVGGFPYRADDFSWAAAHAPLVGLFIGAATGAAFALLKPLGAHAAALLAVTVSALLTGALHEDGLADTADALGGSRERTRILEILKDSRIGTYGSVALFVSLALRVALVAELGSHAIWALPIGACSARVGPACLIAALPYVTSPAASKSRQVVEGARAGWLVAALWGSAAILAGVRFRWFPASCAASLVGALGAVWLLSGLVFRRRAGGITGDFLGAVVQVGEVVALCVLVWWR